MSDLTKAGANLDKAAKLLVAAGQPALAMRVKALASEAKITSTRINTVSTYAQR